MEIHDLQQGSPAWHAYRSSHWNASDAPAMMGVSPYKKRSELVRQYATGFQRDITAVEQSLFDNGHRFEALARPIAENIVGEDLYPVVGSTGKFSASFDGITMSESIIMEHKTLNDDIRAVTSAGDLPAVYRVQMEHQLLVSRADKCLFLATRWEGDELVEEAHFWYEPDEDLRAQIVSGWAQFERDVAAYVEVEVVEQPRPEAIMQLPALAIQLRGEVVNSNLPAYKAAADKFIDAIKTELETDEDFVNAASAVKFCKEAEERLELTKASALSQTVSIDELMRTIDHIRDRLAEKRLTLDKLVTKRKDEIKAKTIADARAKYLAAVDAINASLQGVTIVATVPDFATAIKGKKTIKGLQEAADDARAEGERIAHEAAKLVQAKLEWFEQHAGKHRFLFQDLQPLINRGDLEYFQAVSKNRIDDFEAEQERERQQKEADDARAQAVLTTAQEQRTTEKPLTPWPAASQSSLIPDSSPARAPADGEAMLNLGQINERLAGVSIDAKFLERKGLTPRQEKNAKLYRAADLPKIFAAIIHHVEAQALEPFKAAA